MNPLLKEWLHPRPTTKRLPLIITPTIRPNPNWSKASHTPTFADNPYQTKPTKPTQTKERNND
jgi:hypothetical protein